MTYYLTLEFRPNERPLKSVNLLDGDKRVVDKLMKDVERIYKSSGHTYGHEHLTWIYLEAISSRDWTHQYNVGNVMVFSK